MEQTLRKPTDAEIISSCKIFKSRYGINMFYKPEENLYAACYNSSTQLKILGYYKTFEEAENRLHNLFGEILDKLDKEITENEHLLNV